MTGCSRVIIDGSNQRSLLNQPPADETYAGSLRRLFPVSMEVVVVFDTDPPVGLPTIRRVGGLTIVHARSGGGDDAIVQRVRQAADVTFVVTDDIELRERVTALGASAARNDWLRQRLEFGRSVAPSLGRRGVRRLTAAGTGPEGAEAESAPWRPGRGATVKRGPGHRPPRRRAG